MSTVLIFKGAGSLTQKDAEGFRLMGWKVAKAGRGLKLTGAVSEKTLHALNKAGFWWEINPRKGHMPDGECCASHKAQLRRMPKRKAQKVAKKNPKMTKRGKVSTTETAKRKAEKKAAAWYGKGTLLTRARIAKNHQFPEAFVDAGALEAIEYTSDKFDGTERLYRHDVTKKRKLLISVDGSTIIVQPPFKITKRGIEG